VTNLDETEHGRTSRG